MIEQQAVLDQILGDLLVSAEPAGGPEEVVSKGLGEGH